MTCQAFEPLIALYVEGDLDRPESLRVQEHLAACAGCREILEDFQTTQGALKDLGSEAVDPHLLNAVRSGVLAKIGEPDRWAPWRWGAALAAALAMIAGLIVAPPRKPAPDLRPAPIAQTPASVVDDAAPSTAAPPRRHSRVRVRRPVNRPPAKEAAPLVVKMLTDDPNIVIIWLVDRTGD
jgi:anti-sigma factor RsiW